MFKCLLHLNPSLKKYPNISAESIDSLIVVCTMYPVFVYNTKHFFPHARSGTVYRAQNASNKYSNEQQHYLPSNFEWFLKLAFSKVTWVQFRERCSSMRPLQVRVMKLMCEL